MITTSEYCILTGICLFRITGDRFPADRMKMSLNEYIPRKICVNNESGPTSRFVVLFMSLSLK